MSGRVATAALRLNPVNLWEAGNLLSKRLPAERFTVTTKLRFAPVREGERTGLALFGDDYAWIGAEQVKYFVQIVRVTRTGAKMQGNETSIIGPDIKADSDLWLRMSAEPVVVSNPPADFTPWWPSMLRSTHARRSFPTAWMA